MQVRGRFREQRDRTFDHLSVAGGVTSFSLRTAEVLRRVEAGEEIEVLRDNRPVAGYEWGGSVITLGELRFEPLGIDEAVSDAWALLVSRLRSAGRKAPINDSWIAATAIAHEVPIVTQDAGYDAMPDIEVIKL